MSLESELILSLMDPFFEQRLSCNYLRIILYFICIMIREALESQGNHCLSSELQLNKF